MLQNREVNIDQFIKITAGGVHIADFDQVLAAIIKRYKDAYGQDIDLSNTTADGVFVYDLALIINNILQSFKGMYSNLNVETATGAYLDNICRLSNVSRKPATQSTAQLTVSSSQNVTLESDTIFVDTSGNEWKYTGDDIELTVDATPIVITVTCTEYGPVKANAGSITQTLEASYINVNQPNDANIGQNEETDASLRARRAQSTGATGTTVKQALVGALLGITGVDDAQVIDNNTNADDNNSNGDTTKIQRHSEYIIVRMSNTIDPDSVKQLIGDTIFNKLTPGIGTNQFDPVTSTYDNTGIDENITKSVSDELVWLDQKIYWKRALPINPDLTVQITVSDDYVSSNTDLIGKAIQEYMNNIRLSALPRENDLLIAAAYAAPTFKGRRTYTVDSVDLTSITRNPNTYFYYDDLPEVSQSGNVITFTYSST